MVLATPDGHRNDQKQEKQWHDYRWHDPVDQTMPGQELLLISAGAFICPQSPIEAVGSAVIIHATLIIRR